jgi:hypothetical protein
MLANGIRIFHLQRFRKKTFLQIVLRRNGSPPSTGGRNPAPRSEPDNDLAAGLVGFHQPMGRPYSLKGEYLRRFRLVGAGGGPIDDACNSRRSRVPWSAYSTARPISSCAEFPALPDLGPIANRLWHSIADQAARIVPVS